jgi:hypothetical protein
MVPTGERIYLGAEYKDDQSGAPIKVINIAPEYGVVEYTLVAGVRAGTPIYNKIEKFRQLFTLAVVLLLACVSSANAQQQPPGAYSTTIARPLYHINPYISDPAERARLAYMDHDAVRIMEASTSRAVVVQATANMPDAPFTFVNLTNASATPIEVLVVYAISGREPAIHTRQLAAFQRLSIGLHDDIWTFYGRINMSMTVYFVGSGAAEWSSYRPSSVAGDPPIEVDSKFAEFLPEVRR